MSAGARDDALERLYPFLYGDRAEPDGLAADVEASVAAKAAEVLALRREAAATLAPKIAACARDVAERVRRGGRILAFGNGGSSTDAMEVVGLFMRGAPAIPALSLTADAATVTALTNDVGFDVVFARQIAALGRPEDIALGISTSGGSHNVLAALDSAARRGMLTVGIAGYDGGAMAASDAIAHLLVVRSASVHRIQEVQTTVYHVLWDLTRRLVEDPR